MTTPGSNAIKAMQQIDSNIVCFKKPQVKKKRNQKILSEDHYVQELAKIIQRDFYPDLERLNAQNEYLEAKEKNDLIKLREIYAKYSGKIPFYSSKKNSLGASPPTFETPVTIKSQTPRPQQQGESTSCTSALLPKLSKSFSDDYNLDKFLSTFTSEDNNSFQNIIDAADNKLKKKFAVLFNAEEVSIQKLTDSLKLPSINKQFNGDLSKDINTWSYKNKNYIMYIPDGVEFTEEEKMNFAKNRKKIEYNNTRLMVNPFNETRNRATINDLANKQAKNFNGKIGVDGNTVETKTMSSDVFKFVKTPSPCPGDICSPIMTWGEIGGTPFLLDGSDTPVLSISGPSFRISQTSRRENIALELAEKAGERMRSQKQTAINTARRNIGTPYMRSSIDRKMAMSPAAKKLATLKLGLRTSLMTPEYRHTSKSINKMIRSTPSPIIKKKVNQIPEITKEKIFTNETNLTDDLLNIPNTKRIKASDFF